MSGFVPFGATPAGAGDPYGINVPAASLSLTPLASGFTNVPLTTYGYETPVPVLPIQPDTASLSFAPIRPYLVSVLPDPALNGLAAIVPQTWVVQHEAAIEFRHAPLVPWVMPMTRPVYPPADTSLDLTPAVPDITIHGLWPPSELISGWAYDEGTDTISFPLTSLAGLTAGQADAVTGDWRAVVLALCNTMWDAYVERETPLSALILDYNPGIVVPRGLLANTICAQHRATAYLNFPDKTITDEV